MGERVGSLSDVRPSPVSEVPLDEQIAEELKTSVPVKPGEPRGEVKLNPFGELEESDEGQTT
jgi:hypothetical protein